MLATRLMGSSGVTKIKNLAQTATAQSATGLTTYTFSNVNIGTANTKRIVVVCIAGFAPNTVRFSSVSIGGTAANVDANALQDGATSEGIAVIASRNVPSGSTANIVVTFTSNASFCGIIVYSFVSPNGQANVVGTYAESGLTTGLTNVSGTITTVKGGAIIGCRINNNDSTTWVGLSENVEIDLRTTEWFSGASALSTSTSLSWQSNVSASSTFWALPIVSYSPVTP